MDQKNTLYSDSSSSYLANKLVGINNLQTSVINNGATGEAVQLSVSQGPGSGLNADKVDNYNASQNPTANTIPVAGSNGQISSGWLGLQNVGTTTPTSPWTGLYWLNTSYSPPALEIYTGSYWQTVSSSFMVQGVVAPTYSSSVTLTSSNAGGIAFFTGSTASTFTLPLSNALPSYSMSIIISNQGSAPLTIAVQSGNTMDLQNPILQPNQQVALSNDGISTWHSLYSTAIASTLDGYSPSTIPTANTIPVSENTGQLAIGWLPTGINATTLDSYSSSSSPTANTIPVAGSNGQLAMGWLPSGINATTLDSYSPSSSPTANTIPVAESNGELSLGWLGLQDVVGTTAPTSPWTGLYWLNTSYSPPVLEIFNGSNWEIVTSGFLRSQSSAAYSQSITLTIANSGQIVFFTGTATSTFTLPLSNSSPGWSMFIVISNQGSAPLIIAPQSGNSIDMNPLTLQPGQQCAVENDGSVTWHLLYNTASSTLGGLSYTSFVRTDASTYPTEDNTFIIGGSANRYQGIYSVTFYGNATSANYADLAEKYSAPVMADATVVKVSSNNYEVEPVQNIGELSIIGIVSSTPAFRMNDSLEEGTYIALRGRVKCRVRGPIKKGDYLVSYYEGTGTSLNNVEASIDNFLLSKRIFAIALQDSINNKSMSDEELIEVVI